MMDDNMDFTNINIGKSLGLNKQPDQPSRKIIIAQNKNESVNSNNNKKNVIKDSLNKVYNIATTKDKKIINPRE